MILLIAFAFLAGVITILSPCILPLLPIILSSSLSGKNLGKLRPLGVVVGFVLSFTFFTLFLSTIVRLSGIPADTLRSVSIFIIAAFGISLLIPRLQLWIEQLFIKLSHLAPKTNLNPGFGAGLLVGFSLGLLWTPCVGPILASVISLAISGVISLDAFLITFAYSLGTAVPMFIIMIGGQNVLTKVPWLLKNTANLQKAFGVLMVLTAIGIFFNIDRKFQTFILDIFPQWGANLTKFEDNQQVIEELNKRNQSPTDESMKGKPMLNFNFDSRKLAPPITQGGEWFNSQPLKLSDLRGKVVLIDFWTYSCINCQRTFPYLKDWWDKYQDKGLVIIGIHSPEFEFEKSAGNLQEAISDFNIKYPVVQDNNFATWRAYNNHYWPAKYLIDKDGFIRYSHFGEGAYDETEEAIQRLLGEINPEDLGQNISNPTYQIYSKTAETYLGYGRINNFASPEQIVKNKVSTYTLPDGLGNNQVAFEGEWTVMEEYSNPEKGASLYLNFDAKEVFLVMRTNKDRSKIKVFIDDKMQYFGADNKDGEVIVDTDRLYKLINLIKPGRHILRLEFEDNNVELYAFTFG